MTWPETIAAVERMRTLTDDWDGEGSPAPSVLTIRRAMEFCRAKVADGWRPPDLVHASVNGSIYMEWLQAKNRRGLYMEAEVMPHTVDVRRVHRSLT